MDRVIGLGAGGHAKVVMDILRLTNSYELFGLLDIRQDLWGVEVSGVPVLGDDTCLRELHERGIRHAFIGLGHTGNAGPRTQLYEKAHAHGFQLVPALHPDAVVASSVEMGEGPTVMAGAIINADARLGDNVIVNTGAIVEHDCVIDDHAHVATGSRLASSVHVEEGALVGVGASVRQLIRIGRNAIVGAGAAVVEDVSDDVVVAGVPARIMRSSER